MKIHLLLACVLLLVSPAWAASNDEVRARVDRLIDQEDYTEAVEMLLALCDRICDPEAPATPAELDNRTRELTRSLSFNVAKLINAGPRHAKEIRAARARYAAEAAKRNFAINTRVLVHGAMTLDMLFSTPEASLALYDAIPEASRIAFKVDRFVFDGLWNARRFAVVASSEWPDQILVERAQMAALPPDERKLYPARTRARHIAAVARVIAAKRSIGQSEDATNLLERAAKFYSANEIKGAVEQAEHFIANRSMKS